MVAVQLPWEGHTVPQPSPPHAHQFAYIYVFFAVLFQKFYIYKMKTKQWWPPELPPPTPGAVEAWVTATADSVTGHSDHLAPEPWVPPVSNLPCKAAPSQSCGGGGGVAGHSGAHPRGVRDAGSRAGTPDSNHVHVSRYPVLVSLLTGSGQSCSWADSSRPGPQH